MREWMKQAQASAAGRVELAEAHLFDNLPELRRVTERIKPRILSQGEELHIALPASAVEPRSHPFRFAECRIGGCNVVGGRALARTRRFQFIEKLTSRVRIAGNRVSVRRHRLDAVVS